MRAILRLLAVTLAIAVPLAAASPVFAQDDDEIELDRYDQRAMNKLAAGLNNMITAPADPVMFAIEGNEVFEDFWYPQVTGRMAGFLVGCFQMPYRLITGAFDFVTFPITPMIMVSPAPRFHLIPNLHDME